ncbi:MAG: hypothetical protein AMJ66_00855 [Betaproteobacteria bacterium SG8_40]|jgi:hypothetical protein|nr:MAG: hypothetical protein AMJ66_00855 [Betaproteobacteria bacterium SG8_40]
MLRFSFRQWILLVFGSSLILLSVSLERMAAFWDEVSSDDPVIWNRLTIDTGRHTRISSLDESTLVVRSTSNADARLTLFIRENRTAGPGELVKDLCGRDSCVYRRLDDARLDGAIADYSSGTPFRIILMHLHDSRVWLEYKGPKDEFTTFDHFIDAVVTQTQAQAERRDES